MIPLQGTSEPPFARWESGAWTVRLAGEPPFRVEAADGAIEDRAAEVTARGLDRALVALSSPLGADQLPAAEALTVLDAWVDAAAALPLELGWRAAGGEPGDPAWWGPCGSYVAQLHAAWHAFATRGCALRSRACGSSSPRSPALRPCTPSACAREAGRRVRRGTR